MMQEYTAKGLFKYVGKTTNKKGVEVEIYEPVKDLYILGANTKERFNGLKKLKIKQLTVHKYTDLWLIEFNRREYIKVSGDHSLILLNENMELVKYSPKEIAQAVQSGGADFVSVHGRTKKGAYKAEVDYDAIALMKENIDIPLIANGDITNFTKAQQVLKHTKADGVMIGRGAIGAPWIFYQLHNMSDEVSAEIKAKIVLAHLDAMVEFYGEYGVVKFCSRSP